MKSQENHFDSLSISLFIIVCIKIAGCLGFPWYKSAIVNCENIKVLKNAIKKRANCFLSFGKPKRLWEKKK
jgi:hypothetical protein